MKLLIIGLSDIVRRRVLPAAATCGIARVDVASRHLGTDRALPEGITGEIFADYDEALSRSKADLVYISTVNATHAYWAEKALGRGFHVIVDKPACTNLEDAQRIADLALKKQLCLAEAVVYEYHPHIRMALEAFTEAGSAPTRLCAVFSFPPLPKDNFRYQKDCGGGAFLDLGPYAVTPGRIFFGQEPSEIVCRVCECGDQVETAFSVLAMYEQGRSMVGHFGFNTGYRNSLDILGPGCTVSIPRVFTTPPELVNELPVNQHNTMSTIRVPATDSFAAFLAAVLGTIAAGAHDTLTGKVLSDARTLHRMTLQARVHREGK